MSASPESFGRFNVLKVLGRGAMGVVYLAEDPVLGRKAAIKVVQVHDGHSPEAIEEMKARFQNEARLAAKLSHPNLVPVYEAGFDDGALFIAMEYVEGESLSSVVKSDRVLTYKEIADLVLQVGSALDHAHEHGIVHRDIKPANILLTRTGQPKITDFGVARQDSSELTATGTMLGTPAYMSPEQVTGHPVTGASDQFSLGILLYELLTGRRPFDGDAATTILYQIVHEPPKPPDQVREGLPPAIAAPVLRALEKKPEDRFPSCFELADAVREALGAAAPDSHVALATGARRRPPSAPAGSNKGAGPTPVADAAAATPWWARLGLASTPSTPALAGLGAAVVLVVAVVGWMIAGGSGAPGDDGSEAAGPNGAEAGSGVAGDGSGAGAGAEVTPAETATFRITSRPAGAEVSLDGTTVGRTPIDVDLDPAHTYTIQLSSPGYDPLGWRFSVANLPQEQQRAAALFFPLRAEGSDTTGSDTSNLPPVDPVQVRGGIEAPSVVSKVEPDFPDWAAEQGLSSFVILELVVDEQGRVRDARVLREVHPTLEEIAIAAAKRWRLEPATDDGEPVAVFFNVTVTFKTN